MNMCELMCVSAKGLEKSRSTIQSSPASLLYHLLIKFVMCNYNEGYLVYKGLS